MNTISNLMMTAALASVLAATASAQYAPPVREVEKEARSAVTGICTARIYTPNSVTSFCSFPEVPTGKVLAVRNVSVRCATRSGVITSAQFYGPQDPALAQFIPLQTQGTDYLGNTVRIGSEPSFLHVTAPNRLHFTIYYSAGSLPGAECIAHYQGFLLDQQ